MSENLPLLGVALRAANLKPYLDWLIADQRSLEIQDFIFAETLDGDPAARVREIKALLDGYTGRLGIHGPFFDLPLDARERRLCELVRDRMKAALEAGAALGATHMVVHSPLNFLGAPAQPSYLQETYGRTVENMQPIVEQAAAMGCTLVIENTFDRSPRLLTDLVRAFGSPYVRQSLDCGHAHVNHVQGAPPPDQYVYEAGDLLGHLHVQDTDGHADRHWPCGTGNVNWYSIFAALEKTQAKPRLILEFREGKSVLDGARWLHERGFAR